jgi:hypothetical protein
MNLWQKWGVVGATAMILGTPTYWVGVQGDPSIKPCDSPFVNDGKGNPKTVFRAGETMYTMRNDMFLNKVSGSIQRAFIRDAGLDGSTLIKPLDLIMPPKLTPSGLCSKANFATVIPKDLPPGAYTYSVTVFMRKNPIQTAVAVPFPTVRITVVE